MRVSNNHSLKTIGWREWVALPGLDIPFIKAKVDTGARTSALHTFDLEPYTDKGAPMVRFSVHPRQSRQDISVTCHTPVLDRRWVTDSGGHREQRHVILTRACLGDFCWDIEMTLTNRDTMRFRMLLGRTAMAGHFLVDPKRSYLVGQKPNT